MNRRMMLMTGVAAAMLAGGTFATAASDTGAPRRAAEQAKAAEKAIAKHRADKAVPAAEAAVALAPQNARYRGLLGEAYLTAGRFASAAAAFGDALSLDPTSGTAALQLALAQIGSGDWGAARATLTKYESSIPAADRGLAIALAGDPAAAVVLLTTAARTPGADAKTRQNLALALALSGRWPEARTVAAVDVAPDKLDARILQWVQFAQPKTAADQVAALLGVVPVEDSGQPVQLALARTAPAMAAVAQPVDPVDAYMPTQAPAAETVAEIATVVKPVVAMSGIKFAERREIVQAIPVAAPRSPVGARPTQLAAKLAPLIKATPMKIALTPQPVAARTPIPGQFFVQLGAYENAGVARDAWSRLARLHPALATLSPQGGKVNAGGMTHYRLSVGGFDRGDAMRLCGNVRAGGGSCFVRAAAGDTVAAWGRSQVASR